MAKLAVFTFGVLIEPPGHQKVQDYMELGALVMQTALEANGFIAYAHVEQPIEEKTPFEQNWGAWGQYQTPRFYTGSRKLGEDCAVQTLSLWRDVQSVFDYSYRDYHVDALRQRNKWANYAQGLFPQYTAWWVGDDEIPTWPDACKRLEHLHDEGASPYAFTLKVSFDASGEPTKVKKSILK